MRVVFTKRAQYPPPQQQGVRVSLPDGNQVNLYRQKAHEDVTFRVNSAGALVVEAGDVNIAAYAAGSWVHANVFGPTVFEPRST